MLGYARILNQSRGDLVENPLRVGEVVRFRSGGPAMTVVGFVDGDRVDCLWADSVGASHRESFEVGILERASRRRSFFGLRR